MKINLQNWCKVFNRPLPLQQAQIFSISGDKTLEKIIGRGMKNSLYIVRENSADAYFLNNEREEFNDYFFNKQFKNKKFLGKINNTILNSSPSVEKFFKQIAKKNLDILSNDELLEVFKDVMQFLNTNIAGVAFLWVGFILGEITDKKVIEVLERNNINTEEGLGIISGLEKPHHIIQEQLDLMKIVLSNEKKKEKLTKHYNKYRYIPCYSAIIEPYSLEYFKDRLRKTSKKEAEEYIHRTKNNFKLNAKKYKLFIKNHKWGIKDKMFLDYAHQHCFLKDYRSHFRSLSMLQYGRILKEVAKRFDLNLREVSSLLYQEVIDLFSNPNKIKSTLKKRLKENQIYIYKNGKGTIITNKDVLTNNIKRKPLLLRGQSACPGIVTGNVKVILTPNDINKVNDGDILVSTMTRPDYVVAMRKSKAIITDEGGLLCHAAIVSRELKKPCIIGTKFATQTLKDGDLVEVNANTGIIKLIK